MGVDINWGLGQGNNALGMFQQGAQIGGQIRQQREQTEYRNALLEDRKAQTQQRQAEFAREGEDRAAKQAKDHQGQVVTMAKLLTLAKKNPQAAIGAAKQLGMDTSMVPPIDSPDFQNWVDQQSLIVQAYQNGGGEALSTAGKQATDMGYKPGTPEFNQAVREIWTAGESKPYVVGGDTRLYSPKIGGPGQAVGSPPPEAIDELKRDPSGAAEFDDLFGQGASASILGQGGQPAQGPTPFEEAFQDIVHLAD